MNINNCENILELIKTEVDRLANEKPKPRSIVLSEAQFWDIHNAILKLVHTKKVIKDVLDNDIDYDHPYGDDMIYSRGLRKLEDLIKL